MRACVGVFPCMMEDVCSQLGRLNERFAAELTLMRFVAGMCTKMTVECLLGGESSTALQKSLLKLIGRILQM